MVTKHTGNVAISVPRGYQKHLCIIDRFKLIEIWIKMEWLWNWVLGWTFITISPICLPCIFLKILKGRETQWNGIIRDLNTNWTCETIIRTATLSDQSQKFKMSSLNGQWVYPFCCFVFLVALPITKYMFSPKLFYQIHRENCNKKFFLPIWIYMHFTLGRIIWQTKTIEVYTVT